MTVSQESSLFSNAHATFIGETAEGKPLERAIAFANTRGLPVFGKEQKSRSFVVTGYNNFFLNYIKNAPHSNYCYHEYILGVCNLFLDLDAERFGNPHLYPDEQACNLVLDTVLSELYRRFQIRKEQVQVIALDSSSEKKLSRHYILNIADSKGCYRVGWKSARECGLFMKGVISRLPVHKYPGLYITTADGKNMSIIDQNVYGKNHSLRMYMSKKPIADSKLLRTAEEQKSGSYRPSLITFLQSLVCYFLGNDQKQMRTLLHLSEERMAPAPDGLNWSELARNGVLSGKRKRVENTAHCPDSYFRLVQETLPFQLYGQRYDAEKQRLFTRTYSKQCELLGGTHEKNHVFYWFDFRKGIYWQGCPNETHGCAAKRGTPRPIPNYTAPTLNELGWTPQQDISLALLFPGKPQFRQY